MKDWNFRRKSRFKEALTMHTGYSSIRRSRCRDHVSRKPSQCTQVPAPYTGHVVEVTFRSHYNAYDLFSNTTRLSSSLFNGGKIMLYSNMIYNSVESVKCRLWFCTFREWETPLILISLYKKLFYFSDPKCNFFLVSLWMSEA